MIADTYNRQLIQPKQQRQLLSVVIPAYNAAKTLGEQLDALKEQVYDGDWEIVVVDNCSMDNTADVVRDYQSLMPNLRLVSATERQGRAYACNVGARAAKGDALIFCDADDVAASGWLQAFADALEQHDLVAGTIEVDRLNQFLPWHSNPPNWATQRNLDFLPFAGGALMALSRRAYEASGGFMEDAPFCEDIDISWRLQLRGYPIHHAPAAVMHVRYRETWQAMWRQTVIFATAHVYLYKRFAAQGMPRSSTRKAWQRYKWLVRRAPRLWRMEPKARYIWLHQAAACWGRLKGSLRYRVLYL